MMDFKEFCEITSMTVSGNAIIQTEGMKGDKTKVGNTAAAKNQKPMGKNRLFSFGSSRRNICWPQERCLHMNCKFLHLNTSLLRRKKKPYEVCKFGDNCHNSPACKYIHLPGEQDLKWTKGTASLIWKEI